MTNYSKLPTSGDSDQIYAVVEMSWPHSRSRIGAEL
jgi:hypothetical protein